MRMFTPKPHGNESNEPLRRWPDLGIASNALEALVAGAGKGSVCFSASPAAAASHPVARIQRAAGAPGVLGVSAVPSRIGGALRAGAFLARGSAPPTPGRGSWRVSCARLRRCADSGALVVDTVDPILRGICGLVAFTTARDISTLGSLHTDLLGVPEAEVPS